MSNASLKKKALELASKGKYEEAIDKYKKYLSSGVQSLEEGSILNKIGDLYYKLGRADDGFNTYQRAVDVYKREQLYNNAVAIAKKILRKVSGDIQKEKMVYRILIDIYVLGELIHEAVEYFEELINLLNRSGEIEEALLELSKMVDVINSQSNFLLYLRALNLYKTLNQNKEAIKKFQPILARYEAMGDKEKVEILKNKLTELDPDFALSYQSTQEITQSASVKDIDIPDNPDDLFVDNSPYEDDVQTMQVKGGVNFATGETTDIFKIADLTKKDNDAEGTDIDNYGMVDLDASNSDEKIETVEDTTIFDIDNSAEFLAQNKITNDLSTTKSDTIASDTSYIIKETYTEEDLETLENYLVENPTDSNANYNVAKIYISKGMLEEAYGHLELAKDGFLAEENYKLAWETITKMIELHPSNKDNYDLLMDIARVENDMTKISFASFELAKFHYIKKEYDEAEVLLERSVRFDPANKAAAKLLEAIRNGETAASILNDLDVEEKEELDTKQDSEEGIFIDDSIADDIFITTPKNETERSSSDESLNISDTGEIERNINKSEDIIKKSNELYNNENNVVEGITAGLDKALEGEDFDSHYDIGVAYKDMGLYNEAINEFKIATKGKTQKLKAYEMWGLCLLGSNRDEEALEVFAEGLKVKGYKAYQYLGLYYRIGEIYEKHKRYQQALKLYNKIYKIDANFKDDNFIPINRKINEIKQKVIGEIKNDMLEDAIKDGQAGNTRVSNISNMGITKTSVHVAADSEKNKVRSKVNVETKHVAHGKDELSSMEKSESQNNVNSIRKPDTDAEQSEKKKKKKNKISFI